MGGGIGVVGAAAMCVAMMSMISSSAAAEGREYLEGQNEARAGVGVGSLVWSRALENASRKVVEEQRERMGCRFAELSGIKYGANQFFGGGSSSGWTPRMAVDKWVEEKKYYNYSLNSCAPNHKCGTYTQVVWRNSSQLGCSQANCIKEMASLILCFYNPPGNYVGLRPY